MDTLTKEDRDESVGAEILEGHWSDTGRALPEGRSLRYADDAGAEASCKTRRGIGAETQPETSGLSTKTVLWSVAAIKLVALAVVCVAFPVPGTVMLVTNLLLCIGSPLNHSGWAFTVMLAVNVVLWQVACLSCPGLSSRAAMLCAFVFTVVMWLPIRVQPSGSRAARR